MYMGSKLLVSESKVGFKYKFSIERKQLLLRIKRLKLFVKHFKKFFYHSFICIILYYMCLIITSDKLMLITLILILKDRQGMQCC